MLEQGNEGRTLEKKKEDIALHFEELHDHSHSVCAS